MTDSEGPTTAGIVGTLLLFICSFTLIKLFSKESQARTIVQLLFLTSGIGCFFAYYRLSGPWYTLLLLGLVYLSHSIISGIYIIFQSSTNASGSL